MVTYHAKAAIISFSGNLHEEVHVLATSPHDLEDHSGLFDMN